MKCRLCTTPLLAYTNFGLPFILTKDASKVAVAAILSQVQKAAERRIAYVNRHMKKAEQTYSASEAEMLALVWATKCFPCNPYGKRFLVRTDLSALSYLRSFADNNSRLMRWSLRLSAFDFVFEHKAGSKIGHVYALSRHVSEVMDERIPNKERIFQEQRKEAFCIKQTPGIYSSRSDLFFLDDDCVIYGCRPNDKHHLVLPKALIYDVIKANHDPVYIVHPGMKLPFNTISLGYWWPSKRKSIEDLSRDSTHVKGERRTENL